MDKLVIIALIIIFIVLIFLKVNFLWLALLAVAASYFIRKKLSKKNNNKDIEDQ